MSTLESESALDLRAALVDIVRSQTPHRHYWVYVADEMGDAHEAHLYADCSYMECYDCGETREVTGADIAHLRDQAEYDAYEARS